jgi:hypothetical protein
MYRAKATQAPITMRRMVSHVDRVIGSTPGVDYCLASILTNFGG